MTDSRLNVSNYSKRLVATTFLSVAFLLVFTFGPGHASLAADLTRPSYSAAKGLREDSTLRAVAFHDASLGVAVGDRGTIMKTNNGGQNWSLAESQVDCELSDVVWLSDKRVVAVGGYYDTITQLSHGAVVISDDEGMTWRRVADQELSKLHRVSFDPDRKLTISAGDWSPVSISTHHASRDGGSTWGLDDELFDTESDVVEPTAKELRQWVMSIGSTAPIRDACRVSEQLYWAVGDHGCIYHSDDGGHHWTSQRGEGRQTAVLVIASNCGTVPWSLVGNECIELGNRVSILMLDPQSFTKADPTQPRIVDLVRQAAITLGASGVDVAEATDASELIAAHRPSVVVLDDSLALPIREALSQAAIEVSVQRIVIASNEAIGGETRLHHSAMLPHAGVLAGDLSQDAMNLVKPGLATAESLSLQRAYDAIGAPLRGASVTSGMALTRFHRLESVRPQASRRQLQIIQARLSEPKRVAQATNAGTSESVLAHAINTLLEQSSTDDRLRLAFGIYFDAVKSNNVRLQKITLKEIASHEEFGSPALLAQLRLDAIKFSQEWHRIDDGNFAGSGLGVADTTGDGTLRKVVPAETVALSPFQSKTNHLDIARSESVETGMMQFDASRVVTASATSPILVPESSPEIATPIEATSLQSLSLPRGQFTKSSSGTSVDLTWEFHPLVLMAREAFRSQSSVDELKSVVKNNGNLERFNQSSLASSWARLGKPNTQTTSVVARTAATPPRLDGVLADDCWSGLATMVNDAEVRLAYDSQFLYVAVKSQNERLRNASLPVGAETSIRDNDLTNVDRLSISIDVDGDLMTAFHLQTTVNRMTSDTIDGQTQWQPTWYVATAEANESVVFETAILLSDLVTTPVTPGESWLYEVKCLNAGTFSMVGTMADPSGWIRFVFE